MLQTNDHPWPRRIKKKEMFDADRVRREGGGRIPSDVQYKDMDETFLSVISAHIAGDPMDEEIKWVKLTRHQISLEMKKLGISVSRNIVRKLLKKHGFVSNKADH